MKLSASAALVVTLLLVGVAHAGDPSDATGDKPVSEKEATEWAHKVEAAIKARDPRFLDEALDVDELVRRALVGLPSEQKLASEYAKGVRKSALLGSSVCASVGSGGTFTLLRVRTLEGNTAALFRMKSAGVNYVEYALSQRDGEIHVVDFFNYILGEPSSATFRRFLLPVVAEKNRSAIDKLTGADAEYVKSIPKWNAFIEHAAKGESQAALDAFAALPESMQKQPNILVQRQRAAIASQLPAEIEKADADLDRWHRSNPYMALALIDGRIRKKDVKGAIQLVDVVDKAIGGDPDLLLLRARIAFKLGDSASCKEIVARALKVEAVARDANWLLVDVSLQEKAWADTVAALEALAKIGVTFKDLRTIAVFAEFVKSKEFADWRAAHAPKK